MQGLRLGAVVLLDALGFKGIWNRFKPKVVLDQLKKLKREGLRLVGDDRAGVLFLDKTFEHSVRGISDTIIVAVTIRGSFDTRQKLQPSLKGAHKLNRV